MTYCGHARRVVDACGTGRPRGFAWRHPLGHHRAWSPPDAPEAEPVECRRSADDEPRRRCRRPRRDDLRERARGVRRRMHRLHHSAGERASDSVHHVILGAASCSPGAVRNQAGSCCRCSRSRCSCSRENRSSRGSSRRSWELSFPARADTRGASSRPIH